MRRGVRRRVAVAALAATVLVACSDGNTDSDDVTSAEAGQGTAVTTSSTPSPSPPLPDGINVIPYGVGQIAALGNLQAGIMAVERNAESADVEVIEIEMSFRNGSLSPLTISTDHIVLYSVDGIGDPAVSLDGTGTTSPIDSGDTLRATARFEFASSTEPALVVVDASPADSRIQPGAFALEEIVVGDVDS